MITCSVSAQWDSGIFATKNFFSALMANWRELYFYFILEDRTHMGVSIY